MKRTLRTPSALHRLALLSVVLPLGASLGACAGFGSRGDAAASAEETEAAELAAASAGLRDVTDELVAVFERVDELGPELAEPLVETRDDPAFTQALETSLEDAGYRLATPTSTAAVPVAYAIHEGEGGVTVTIGMGSVQARRSYSGPLQAAVPAGPLYVRGTDAAGLRGPQAAAPIEMPVVANGPGAGPAIAMERAGGAPELDGVVARALRSLEEPPDTVRNVMSVGDSNFADLLATYRTVGERVMVFPNDSRRLGDDNKALIAAEVERFRPGTDLFSVVGCSLGATTLENGNEVLALGRANRVVEELVARGVPSMRIVDEGCWAGEASARFPSRGVVLTLKRREGALDG